MKTITYTSDKLKREHLILGKNYRVQIEYPSGYVIVNELDIPTWYDKLHFQDLDMIRKKKLDEVLKLFEINYIPE
jgi:hypothetical protein